MKSWALKHNHPYTLVLAADARMSETDYFDDQIWELRLGTGESIALSLHTTYGTRARDMRLFFSFREEDREAHYARDYAELPRIRTALPNLIRISCQPFAKLPVQHTFFAFDSHTLVGRVHLSNPTTQQRNIRLRLGGILAALDGAPLRVEQTSGVHILRGQSSNLHPLLFITGGAEPAETPYAALELALNLGPGASRTFTWVHIGASRPEEAFDQARRIASQPLEALFARALHLHQAETVEIETGDRDWDALLHFSQIAAAGKFIQAERLPHLSLLAARHPDQGYAPQRDARSHPDAWQGQTALDAWYLAQALPGAPQRWRDLLRNFLATQTDSGQIDARPGPAGQRLGALSPPLLADLAWRYWQSTRETDFLAAVYPALLRFFLAWFTPEQDRDGNGLPEWSHPLQTGYDDNPLFACTAAGKAVAIETVQTPALAAMLLHEGQRLLAIANTIGEEAGREQIRQQLGRLQQHLKTCLQAEQHLYTYCDRDTHLTPTGQILSQRRARRKFQLKRTLKAPARLQIILEKARADGQRPQITIAGQRAGQPVQETLPPEAFCWQGTRAVATTQQTWEQLGRFTLEHFHPEDRLLIRTVDLTQRDLTLFLPLWSNSFTTVEAQAAYAAHLRPGRSFGRAFGFAMLPQGEEIRPLWNALLLEGLLQTGLRQEAAEMLIGLGQAAIRTLTTRKAFYAAYHAESGDGLGARHALQGIFPVGLFLKVLGVSFPQERTVRIQGENPFPWPITVRYRTITVERGLEVSRVRWLDDPPLELPAGGVHLIRF